MFEQAPEYWIILAAMGHFPTEATLLPAESDVDHRLRWGGLAHTLAYVQMSVLLQIAYTYA